MTYGEILSAAFPAVRTLGDSRQWLLNKIEQECGGDRRTTLLATSSCSDDITATKDIGHDFWGPFTLGGLGGLPFAGLTGMAAYAHHIPDGGTALILYGPHIGVTRDGTWGRMRRPGQEHETTSCGALMAALDKMRQRDDADPYVPFARDDDQQQVFLERELMPFKPRILNAESPEREITEVTYRLIHKQVHNLFSLTRDQFRGDRVVYVGVVVINTDGEEEDWLDVRDHGVFDSA